jgi:hypothetical protein
MRFLASYALHTKLTLMQACQGVFVVVLPIIQLCHAINNGLAVLHIVNLWDYDRVSRSHEHAA